MSLAQDEIQKRLGLMFACDSSVQSQTYRKAHLHCRQRCWAGAGSSGANNEAVAVLPLPLVGANVLDTMPVEPGGDAHRYCATASATVHPVGPS